MLCAPLCFVASLCVDVTYNVFFLFFIYRLCKVILNILSVDIPTSPDLSETSGFDVLCDVLKIGIFLIVTGSKWDTRWHSCLRHCASSRKVVG
jgi:hypothetical protein